MFSQQLPPPYARSSSTVERIVARVLGVMVWATLALVGLVFALSLLIWLAVGVVASLVMSLVTGRPATVTLLWRRYREMTRQHWPKRQAAATTPRADATSAAGGSEPAVVQDVSWREVP
ncbi:hypothetical protein [Ottowia thiooxydans]|uniref:hypothetical protein n=1 Tax=Ottowia thiooxydans TaxID=219182 RepID=UPI00042003D7|nr:hypothetical protein [Ottowia thiooxydans]